LVVISVVCILQANEREPRGIFLASVPAILWLFLSLFSPESFTAWHWLPDGGPREPWGIPREYTYEFRYASHEQLVGSCVATVAIELLLAALLAMLFLNRRAREFYGFSWRWPRNPTSD
jgi:hypothetical protein